MISEHNLDIAYFFNKHTGKNVYTFSDYFFSEMKTNFILFHFNNFQ